MSFVDLRFLLFFPAVLVLHVLTPHRFRWVLLLVASYVFYMFYKPEYALILLLITAIDFVSALMIEKSGETPNRRLWLLFSIISNLGILFIFKYFNFVFGSIQDVANALHSGAQFPVLSLLLPLGISFHTFQSIAYTIEVYRKKIKATHHFGKFALYVSFFPQLVAGPIERPTGLLPQFFEDRPFRLEKARSGLKLMAWGYFKKVVVADNLAPLVTAVYAHPSAFPGPSLIIAAMLFAYEIYCDFSGYTDIARGAARVLGYELRLNFDRPYTSRSISEFWRRWHMSLSSWLRDYLYYPLVFSGKRITKRSIYISTFITFLLVGLWHGASFTFVVWGMINGFYIIFGEWTRAVREKISGVIFQGFLLRFRPFFQQMTVFALISFVLIFFRSSSLAVAGYIVSHLLSNIGEFARGLTSLSGIKQYVFMGVNFEFVAGGFVGILIVELIESYHANGKLFPLLSKTRRPLRFAVYGIGIFAIIAFGALSMPTQFIYFQF